MTTAFITPTLPLSTRSLIRPLTTTTRPATFARRPTRMLSESPSPPAPESEAPVAPEAEAPVAPEALVAPEAPEAPESEAAAAPEPTTDAVDDVVAEATAESDMAATFLSSEPQRLDIDDEDGPVAQAPQPWINAQAVAECRAKFRRDELDTGSPEYQIATLTTRIAYLTSHLKENPKDNACTRGLLQMVSKRRRLLKYLKREDAGRFSNIVEGLNIRISAQLRAL